MDLLKDALDARIPLIACQSAETVYFRNFLYWLMGKKKENIPVSFPLMPDGSFPTPVAGKVYYRLGELASAKAPAPPPAALYEALNKVGATLVHVNTTQAADAAYLNLGQVIPPVEFVRQQLIANGVNKDHLNPIAQSLSGLTAKQAADFVALTYKRRGQLSPMGILETRRHFLPHADGLEETNTDMPYYVPSEELAEFVELEKLFFFGQYDKRLRPRGILANGDPGTGKTQGAKYIASQWGIPLYRMQANILNKYVGQSENNMLAALNRLLSLSPCVFIMDEIEKFFAGMEHDGNGTTSRMLGTLLWWLQEHDARVLTIMTCNSMSKLPPELYRPGRVDRVLTFKGMGLDDAIDFAMIAAESYTGEPLKKQAVSQIKKAVEVRTMATPKHIISHSDVDGIVRMAIKQLIRSNII